MADKIVQSLPDKKTAYIDADHQTKPGEKSTFLESGADIFAADKIEFFRYDYANSHDRYQRNQIFNEMDLVIINGNHFIGDAQIVVLDEKKPLEKKLSKITNPVLVLNNSQKEEIPAYLIENFPKIQTLPIYRLSEIDKILNFINGYLKASTPKLNGLVLTGGKSTRMNSDKSKLEYHGRPQWEYLKNLMNEFTDTTYVSCRKDQEHEFATTANTIIDSINDLGPYGGILSAFREHPDTAWLTIACDIPLLSPDGLNKLVQNRNTSKIATAFYNETTEFPEPLITIWEPKAYPVLLHFLSLGYSCPRKVLINSDIELIHPDDQQELVNVNNPEEFKNVKKLI